MPESLSRGASRWGTVPLLGLLLVGAIVVAGLILFAARGQDRIAAEKSVALVRAMLATEQRDLAHAVRNYGRSDEAYRNLAMRPNAGWAAAALGDNVCKAFGVTGAFVVDGHDRTVFAFIDGRPAATDLLARSGGDLGRLIAMARATPASEPEPASGLAIIDGLPQLVAAQAVMAQ